MRQMIFFLTTMMVGDNVMPKRIVQCRRMGNHPIHIGSSPVVELVTDHENYPAGSWVLCSRVIRVDTIGYYVVEFETMNTIYETVP